MKKRKKKSDRQALNTYRNTTFTTAGAAYGLLAVGKIGIAVGGTAFAVPAAGVAAGLGAFCYAASSLFD